MARRSHARPLRSRSISPASSRLSPSPHASTACSTDLLRPCWPSPPAGSRRSSSGGIEPPRLPAAAGEPTQKRLGQERGRIVHHQATNGATVRCRLISCKRPVHEGAEEALRQIHGSNGEERIKSLIHRKT